MEALAKLGIDAWGLVLYLVNFGIILVIMERFVYRPLLKKIDERRNVIAENVREAEQLRHTFEEETRKRQRESEAYLRDMQVKIEETHRNAKNEAKEIIANAEERREKVLTETRELVEKMRENILKDAETETRKRIEQAVLYVLENGVSEDAVKDSVTKGWKNIASKNL